MNLPNREREERREGRHVPPPFLAIIPVVGEQYRARLKGGPQVK